MNPMFMMFALILLTDGTYDICDIEQIRCRKRDNTCTVNIHNQRPCQARLLASNETRETLVEITKLLNAGSPKVRIRSLTNNAAGLNNSSILDFPPSSGALFDNNPCRSSQPELAVSQKKRRDSQATALQNMSLTPEICYKKNLYNNEQQLTDANTETAARADDKEHNCTVQNNATVTLANAPHGDNVIFDGIYETDLHFDGDTSQTTYVVSEDIYALIDKDDSRTDDKDRQEITNFGSFENNEYVPIEHINLSVELTERDIVTNESVESTYDIERGLMDIDVNLKVVDTQEELVNAREMDGDSFDEGQQHVDYRVEQCTTVETVVGRDSDKKNMDTAHRGVKNQSKRNESQNVCDEDRRTNSDGAAAVGRCINSPDARSERKIKNKEQCGTQNWTSEVVENEEQCHEQNESTGDIDNDECCGMQNVRTNKNNTQDLISMVLDMDTNRKEERSSKTSVCRGLLFDNINDIDPIDEMSSDDSDYLPSDHENSTDDDDDDDENFDGFRIQESNSGNKKKNAQNPQSISNRLSLSFTDNVPGSSAPDDTRLTVDPSRGPAGDKKKNCCFFCYTQQSKIARHLQTVHKDKPEVQKFMTLPKKSLLRRDEIASLRKKGNFLFNTNAELNTGSRIVARRPNKRFNRIGSDYAHCARCKGSYSKLSIRIHFQNCTGISSKKSRLVMLSSKQIAGMVHSSASDVVRRRIVPVLRDDEVARAVRYDELLITHTNKQCKKYRSEHFDKMIRQRLRMLGRLLLAVRTINKNVTDFASIFNPEVYDDCITAVNSVAGLNEATNSYKAPSTASMLGTLIKQIGKKHISDCIKKKQNDKMKDAEDFLKLLEEDYTISVNSTVSENQAEQRRQKIIKIPAMIDIQKLHDFLSHERKKAFDNLKIQYTLESWRDLAESSLTAIQLFNRRRAGEVERIKIADFEHCKGVDETVDKDLWNQLSEVSKAPARKYVRFEIRGKKGRTVAVLLSSQMFECLKVIIENREKAGVLSTNPYVFGMPSNSSAVIHRHLDACVLMRKFSEVCDASDPKSLRGTELRKHMATKCLALNLNEQDVGEVANFMGHSTDIHKQVYRQTIVSREIMKMSKLLEKAQGDDSDEEENGEYDSEKNEDEDNDDVGNEEIDHVPNARGDDDILARSESEASAEPNSDESLPIRKKTRGRPPPKDGIKSSKKGNKRGEMITQTTQRPTKKRRSSSPHGSVRRIAWTRPEKDTLLKEFGSCVRSDSKKFPSLKRITEFIRENSILQGRTAQQVKSWLSNQKQVNRRSNYE